MVAYVLVIVKLLNATCPSSGAWSSPYGTSNLQWLNELITLIFILFSCLFTKGKQTVFYVYNTVVNAVSKQEIYFIWFVFHHEFATICMFSKITVNGGYVM